MCGITGFVGHRRLPDVRATVERMTATLVRRGPDDQGTYVDRGTALGVRRLGVIDLETGHQPMSNEDGTVWVVQNGEIYNYRTLRDRLRQLGHDFRTQSDTEVIVHALRGVWGGLRLPPRRDVCLRRLGRSAAQAPAGPRPHGREAPLLPRGARGLRLRVRAASVAAASGRSAPARPREPGD